MTVWSTVEVDIRVATKKAPKGRLPFTGDFLDVPVYHPWRLFEWWYSFGVLAPAVFDRAGVIVVASAVSLPGPFPRAPWR